MKVKKVQLSDISQDPANVRKHSERNLDSIAASLRAFGQQKPIVIDSRGIILAGNGTYEAAKRIGWSEIEAVETELSGTSATAYAIADNRTAELAEWDDTALAEQLRALQSEEFDLGSVGYTDDEVDRLIQGIGDSLLGSPEVVQDEVPEPPADPITKPGDLWLLGDHRLLCGDSTKAEDVGRLMAGAKADFCLTDPPYSVNYDESHKQRGGDKTVHGAFHEAEIDPSQLLTFMTLVPADVMVWSYPIDRHFRVLADAYMRHKWELKKELVWVKDSFSFWMSAKYQQKHEPMMLAVRLGKPIGGDVPANATTVFEFPRPKSHDLHPTAKPIQLWAEFIKNHTKVGGSVYDPFLGSGTTLIAAEQLSRKCYGMEISPQYCDVIVKRWETLTGRVATRE